MSTRLIRGSCMSCFVEGGGALAWGRSRRLLAAVVAALAVSLSASGVCQASKQVSSRPPLLHVHGGTLQWSSAGRRNVYRVLVRAPAVRAMLTVSGRSFTPPPVPGQTVFYRVRAAFRESTWSNRAAIIYPGIGEGGPPRGEEWPPPGEEWPHGEEPKWEEPPSGGEGPRVGQGWVRYRLDAASYFDPFARLQYAPWARAHLALIKGYPPFSDTYVSLFGLPVIGYHDPATEGQAPLARSGIEAYVANVKRDISHGYKGVFIDDANWSSGFPPSPGPRANLANLIEAIAAAAPSALIEANSQYHDIWPLIQAGDADVARALRYVRLICVEFGVGPTSGINTAHDYAEFMRYADTVHAKGIHLTLTGDRLNDNVATMEYNLATYFLITDGGDYVNGQSQTPENWWSGFNVNLGSALGGRERGASGLWTRRFAGGVVYTVEPGAAAQTVNLGRIMHSAQWGDVQSITLGAGQGAVLVG
jgi:hypothetical protein